MASSLAQPRFPSLDDARAPLHMQHFLIMSFTKFCYLRMAEHTKGVSFMVLT